MHHDDKRQNSLKHFAILKGFIELGKDVLKIMNLKGKTYESYKRVRKTIFVPKQDMASLLTNLPLEGKLNVLAPGEWNC